MDVLDMMRDAKAYRDAHGIVTPEADAQLARAEAGDFGTIPGPEDTGVRGAGRTITGVKRSGTGAVQPEYTYEATPRGNGNGHGRPAAIVTIKQAEYIAHLLADLKARGWADHDKAQEWVITHTTAGTMTMAMASDTITRLKNHLAAMPKVDAPVTPLGQTPEWATWADFRELAGPLVGGRYAVTGDDGTTDFWYISEWTTDVGRKMISLRMIVGGQSGPVRVRMGPEAMVGVVRKIIADGPKEAMIRYGREIGECGNCGRTLTDAESRAAGIGPVCAKRRGW